MLPVVNAETGTWEQHQAESTNVFMAYRSVVD